jgi:hypothetical protein
MRKETLDAANELERQIDTYKEIAHAMTYPWQKFKLFRKRTYIGAAGYNQNNETLVYDKELANLIADYCREKIKQLNKEIEEL